MGIIAAQRPLLLSIENWEMKDFVLETHTFNGQHTKSKIKIKITLFIPEGKFS